VINIDIEEEALKQVGGDETGGVWASPEIFQKEDNSIVREYEQQLWAISDGVMLIEQVTALEDIFTEAEGDITDQAQKMLQVTLESISARLGVDRPKVALESIATKSTALEGIGGVLKDIWDRIIKMFKAIWDRILKIFSKDEKQKLESQRERIMREYKEVAKKASSQPRESSVKSMAVQKFKHLGNNFDIRALQRDLSTLHDTVKIFDGFEKTINAVFQALNKLVEEKIESDSDYDEAAVNAVFAPLNAYTNGHFPTLTDHSKYSHELEHVLNTAFPGRNARVQKYQALKGLTMGRIFLALHHNVDRTVLDHVYAVIHDNFDESRSGTHSANVPDLGTMRGYMEMIDKVHADFAKSGAADANEAEYNKQLKIMERIRDLSGKKKSQWLNAAPAMYSTYSALGSAVTAMLHALGGSIHDHWRLYEVFLNQYKPKAA
jgi:hypothetical protein